MELERLEVVLEMNTARFEESMKKVMPQITSMLNRIEQATGRNKKTIENNMDMTSATKKLDKTLNDFTNNFAKQLKKAEDVSKKSVAVTGRNLEQGFKKTRTSAGKEVDLMIGDINAKMKQAQAAQNKIAHLTAQRSVARKSGDTDGTIRYDEQIARAEAQMTSYRSKATEAARAMKAEFEVVPNSLDIISTAMEANEVRIELMRKKIADMQTVYESQRKTKGSFSEGFTSQDSPASRDTMLKIQEQTEKMNKLIMSNDQLQQAYATTENRAEALRKVIGGLNTDLTNSSIQTGNASLGMQTVAESSEKAQSMWSRFGGLFNRTSNFIAHGARNSSRLMGGFFSMFGRGSKRATRETNNMSKGTNMLSRTISQLGRRIFVYGILYRGIMTLGKGLFSTLKTNKQFADSLNQIQVNLMTAFYPIYQFALPAINALMSALARLTGYIASFVSALFGTTYTAAKKGAQSLYNNTKAMEETGVGATKAKDKVKELQRSLMGFDEINRIGLDVGADGSDLDGGTPGSTGGGINFDTPDYTTPKWLSNLAKDIRDIMERFFEPIKKAWDTHGKAVMDAFKYALNESWELVKSIGRSFMEVWTNGTGEEFIGNILRLLAMVLNIIGDIARAFRLAWDDDGRGTAAIQATFDALNSILDLLVTIGETFRTVWNDGTGERIAANILEGYTNLVATVSELADRFKEAWLEADNGERIFGVILGVIEKMLETVNKITFSTREWAENLDLEPLLSATSSLLENLEPIIASALDGLSWLYENVLLPIAKWAIENGIPAALDAISAGFELLGAVIDVIKPVLSWVWDKFLVPLASWYGGRVVKTFENVGGALGFMADAVKNPKEAFSDLKDTVTEKSRGVYDSVKEFFGKSSKKIEEDVLASSGMTRQEFEAMEIKSSSAFGGIWDSVKKVFPGINKDVTDNASKANKAGSTEFEKLKENITKRTGESWNSAKGNFTDIHKWVTDRAGSAQKNASNSFKDLRTNARTHFGNLRTNASEVWGNVYDNITTKANDSRANAVNAFSRMKSGIGGYTTDIQNATRKAFDKVESWSADLGSKISSGLRGGVDAVKRGAAAIGNGIVGTIGKAINGVISGINWILDKVGAGKSKLGSWKVPSYATGTDSHPGGLAIVNDAPGANFREAYEVNGQVGLFPRQRNMLVNLPKGAKVLDGERTKSLYGDIPHYAGGVGNWFSKAWDGAKKMVGTVWDYATNPSKLLDIAISKFVNLSNVLDPALSIAKGAISTVSSGATSFIKKFLDGGDDGVITGGGGGVNFRGLVQTSPFGYRIHPIFGTRRLHAGVDYGGGQGIGHPIHAQRGGIVTHAGPSGSGYGTYVRIKQGVYEHIYAHLNRALTSVGKAIKRGDLIGQMGNTGNSTGPHVHYEVRQNGRPVNPMGYENGGLVSNDGYYRLAEGDKKELIIPLERRNRALELLEMAKGYLGVSDTPLLQMPESMLDSPTTRFSAPKPTQEVGGGINGMAENVMQALMQVLADTKSDETIEVVMEMDGDKVGDATIKRINRKTKQAGKSPLIQ